MASTSDSTATAETAQDHDVATAPHATPGAGFADLPRPEGADGSGAAAGSSDDTEGAGDQGPSPRVAVAVAFPTLAAAVLVGGIFNGASPRFYTSIAGLLGIGLAWGLARLHGRAVLTNVLAFAGIFAIGLLLIGPANILSVQALAVDAARSGDVLRPPVNFDPGWKAIIGWLMGGVGFAAGWVGMALRRPALGVLLPLPVAAFAGISVPEDAQVASGIAGLLLFAVSLFVLSSEQAAGEDGTRPSLAYELRRSVRAIALLTVLGVGMYFLSAAGFLFPDTIYDPAQEPQRPRSQPLSQVEDRVLFEVESELSGPWRIGSLDVYDGRDWRLPPFAQNELEEVPRDGVVDRDLPPGVQATFTVAGLGGAVLPTLPNTVGIVAEGPNLAYDSRNGNIRLVNGQVSPGQRYTVAAAALPSVDDLKAIATFDAGIPREIRRFTYIGDVPADEFGMPPAVADLLQRAEDFGPSKWEHFDFARTFVLDNVTASGTGSPVSVTPERVQDILAGSRKASPFEIVATQALLARWLGIPARIGYGFDGGEEVDGRLQVRPIHGAAFVEVYFPGFKWLPVIGTPKKAEPTVGSDPSQQRVDPSILPSDDVAVQVFLPTVVPPPSVVAKQVAIIAMVVLGLVLLILLVYSVWPALLKARRQSRARRAAMDAGVRARVALAYAEWRDWATDFGFGYGTDTPLMYLDRFQEDEEHTELAWLTTRVLWGDLQHTNDPMIASVAEELSRSLRRRLAAGQPATVRIVALLSRLSLKHPYAPETDLSPRRSTRSSRKEEEHAPVPA